MSLESLLRGVRFRLTRKLSTRAPETVWPGLESVEVRLMPFSGRFANIKRYELIVLSAVAKHIRARTVFEFGTFNGLTTWHLGANCGTESHTWTLDLPVDHPARSAVGHENKVGNVEGVRIGDKFLGSAEAYQIEQLYGDSLEFNPTPYLGQIDFCFIDAGHSYENVVRDTENALVMASPGGVVFWHDYSRWWPGVQKALDDLVVRLPVFRVEGTSLAAVQLL